MLRWIYATAVACTVGAVSSALPTTAGPTKPTELVLSTGQQQLMSYDKKIKRVAVGNAAVLGVRTLKRGKELLITGKGAGSSDLTVWQLRSKQLYRVHVLSSKSAVLLPTLKTFFATLEGVRLRQMDREILVEGKLLRATDRLYIRRLISGHAAVRDLTTMHPDAMAVTVALIERELAKQQFNQLRISAAGERIFVEGGLLHPNDTKRVERIVLNIYPEAEFHIDSPAGAAEMLLVDVKMVVIRKNALKRFGITWPPAVAGRVVGEWGAESQGGRLSLANPLEVSLQALESRGLARVLSNPKLSCRYENPCAFHAGGEIPIPLIGERSVRVEFKSYGVKLSLTPHLLSAKRDGAPALNIDVHMEFSTVDPSTAVQGIPGLLKNDVKTSATVSFNQSVVLSGLFQTMQGKSRTRVPFLADIPLIGEIFKSRSFDLNHNELVLFLTPLPMRAGDRRNRQMIERAAQRYEMIGERMGIRAAD